MPTFDATGLSQNLNVTGGDFDFATAIGPFARSGTAFYEYLSSAGNLIRFEMADSIGLTGNVPTSGTVVGVEVELANGNPGVPDIIIDDLFFDVTEMDYSAGSQAAQTFWATVLQGDIEYLAPPSNSGNFFGDFLTFDETDGHVIGADDLIIGGQFPNTYLSGEGLNLWSGIVIGGNDTLTGSFYEAQGDVRRVNDYLVGGDDLIRTTLPFGAATGLFVYGDAREASTGDAVVVGGNDTIDVGLAGGNGISQLAGDVGILGAGSILQGGDDLIIGTAGSDVIGGDVYNNFGTYVGGDDTLFGRRREMIRWQAIMPMAQPPGALAATTIWLVVPAMIIFTVDGVMTRWLVGWALTFFPAARALT